MSRSNRDSRCTKHALRLTPIAAGLLAALSFSHIAYAAQEGQAAPQDEQANTEKEAKGGQGIERIIVTARKRDERQIDVPIAMSSFTGQEMQDKGMANIVDALKATPGVSSESAGSGITSVQVRGVSSSLGGNVNGYYLDEAPFTGVTVPLYPDTRSWDLERVEILKGPQGTLFGEGSMGGTVRIITNKPDMSEFGLKLQASGSTTKDGENGSGLKGMVNVPIISDTLALRASVTDERLPGWVDDTVSGEEDINDTRVKTYRAKLRFAPTDNLTMDLGYWKSENYSTSDASSFKDRTIASGTPSPLDNEWDNLTFVTTYDLENSQVVYSYSDLNFDIAINSFSQGPFAPIPGAILTQDIKAGIDIGVRTHELRWGSTGRNVLDWTVGYYNRSAERNEPLAALIEVTHPVLGTIVSNRVDSLNHTLSDAWALFGETSLNFNDQWALTTGLRYFSENVDANSANLIAGTNAKLDDTFDSWNPRVSLSFKPVEDTTIYASAAKGFRSGQLQTSSAKAIAATLTPPYPLPDQVKPDTIWTYELGMKSLFADGMLTFEGAVYYSDWKDNVVRIPLATGFNGMDNASSTTKGVELGLLYRPISDLVLQVSGSVADATYSETVDRTGIVDGTPVYDVPKTTVNASASYSWDMFSNLTGMAYLAGNYTSARETNALGTNPAPGDATTNVTARIGVESQQGWGIFLTGSNLLDDDGFLSPASSAGTSAMLQPRTFGIELNYSL